MDRTESMDDPDFTQTAMLVRRAQGGDDEATDKLFRRYYRHIRPYVRARLGPGVRRDFDSLDIVQDAFAVALRKLDDFELRDEVSFIRWMRRIVEHQITDKVDWQHAKIRDRRREVRITPAEDGSDSDVGWQPESPGTNPLDAMVRNDRRERVEARLRNLPERYREVIALRIDEGLCWEEVGERLGERSPDAVRMMFAKAVRMLVRQVRPGGGD